MNFDFPICKMGTYLYHLPETLGKFNQKEFKSNHKPLQNHTSPRSFST